MMKTIRCTFIIIAACLIGGCSNKSATNGRAVNPVIGDVSFTETYGQEPTAETDEDLRVGTHLAYVENRLRTADVSRLSPALRENREYLLDLLQEYHMAGVFPRNHDHRGVRKPCFIDRDGRICAVGYLIERTVGREVAESIDRDHRYERLLAMDDPRVDRWVAASGLTKMECAMIQPAYGNPIVIETNNNRISRGYGISSAIFTGVNVSVGTVNALQIGRGTDSKVMPLIGLATGVAQATMGILEYPDDETDWRGEQYTNVAQRDLSLLNIGLGTANVLLSSWNLITNRPARERRFSWGVQRMALPDNRAALGFNVAKRF